MPLTRIEAKVLQDLTQKARERLTYSIMPVFEIAQETPEKFGELKVDAIAKKHEHMVAVFEILAEVSALLRVDEQD